MGGCSLSGILVSVFFPTRLDAASCFCTKKVPRKEVRLEKERERVQMEEKRKEVSENEGGDGRRVGARAFWATAVGASQSMAAGRNGLGGCP